MKMFTKQSDKRTAFTIIELLTVMSIIIILIGLLVPSLNLVKKYAKDVKQKAQFYSINSALEMFSSEDEYGRYPDSRGVDDANDPYCGAMRLCEAMMGQDLAGFHPFSTFLASCKDANGGWLYANNPAGSPLSPDEATNLKLRKTPFLPPDNANPYRLKSLYSNTGVYSGGAADLFVMCDTYTRVINRDTGKRVGMPVLYYKANKGSTLHDPTGGTVPTDAHATNFIYNYYDNKDLVDLGVPPAGGTTHPLANTSTFYDVITNKKIAFQSADKGWPYKPDTYILISAGYDGIYGTDDDMFNFEK